MFEYKLFGNLINCKELANVEFLVGNQCKKLYAHKLILSMRSKFFKQILYPCGWEQSSVQIVQITLSDIAFESFEVILNYLYTNEIALNFDSFWDVILCSQKFQLPKLYQLCLRWFQNRVNETNFICHFLNAYQIKNKDVLDIMFVYFEKNFPHLIQSKKFFNELDLEMFKVFVQKINQIKSSSEMKEIIWIRFIEFIICYFNKSRQCTSKEIVRAIEDLLVTPKFVVNKNLQLVDTELERLISHNFVERVNCPRFSHDDLKVNEKGNECKNENEKQCKNETTACTILENKSSKNKNQQHTQQQQQQKQQQQQQKPGADLIKDHFSDQSLMSSLKQNTPLRHPIFPNLPVNAQMLKVLLVSTDQLESHLEDVKKSLLVKGNIRYIHTFHACDSTPSYEHLKKYDSVFLFSSINAFQNSKKLGDSLAKFVDNGGGLVMSTYRCLFKRPKKYKGAELKGRIVSKGYLPIKKGVLKDKRSSLGEILIKNHPTMDGIKKFDGGMLSYRIKFNKSHLKSNSNFVSNRELNNLKNQKKCYSIIVAKWSDGNPLIFYNYSPNMKGKIVYLNFWPISGEVYGYKGKYNYWQNKYDGRKIIANAIHFSALKEEVF